ncbi:MAG: hypothetical protein ACI85I_000741 [Arenicella sp.]|jgi:hypothetical protein
MRKSYLSILAIVFVFILTGCAGDGGKDVKGDGNDGGGEEPEVPIVMSDEIINDIIQSIPSPLEITTLIQEGGAIYNRDEMNDDDAVSKYTTNFKKALNLGVYGTDLGYANIYGKNQDAISYLNSVQTLAKGLAIEQFFDYKTLKRLAESADNLDSLILTTTQNFEKINYHLREQKRESLSILLLTGGWVEATYLTTLVYNKKPNSALKDKIGEQKIVLGQILLVLDVYRNKPGFPELIDDLRELQKVYDNIEIETKFVEPEMVEKNGELIFIDKSISEINITEDHIKQITSLVNSIRDTLIE